MNREAKLRLLSLKEKLLYLGFLVKEYQQLCIDKESKGALAYDAEGQAYSFQAWISDIETLQNDGWKHLSPKDRHSYTVYLNQVYRIVKAKKLDRD